MEDPLDASEHALLMDGRMGLALRNGSVLHAKPTHQDKHFNLRWLQTLKAIDFDINNGIIMTTFPPHCTHKMQPLDIAYFQSCKETYNRAADNWMVSIFGK